jgi:hypothetical protein
MEQAQNKKVEESNGMIAAAASEVETAASKDRNEEIRERVREIKDLSQEKIEESRATTKAKFKEGQEAIMVKTGELMQEAEILVESLRDDLAPAARNKFNEAANLISRARAAALEGLEAAKEKWEQEQDAPADALDNDPIRQEEIL